MRNSNNPYKDTTGYTANDIQAVFKPPEFLNIDAPPMIFGEINTISYSIYRDKFPVRALGYSRAKGYTKGTRTVAGSISFTMLEIPIINKFVDMLYGTDTVYKDLGLLPDELPPFSIDINYYNEFGGNAIVSLIGVELAEGNQVITIEDMQVNEQYSFVAQDIVQSNNFNRRLKNKQEQEGAGGGDVQYLTPSSN